MNNKFPVTVEDLQSGQSVRTYAVHVGDCGLFVESPEIFKAGTAISCHLGDGEKTRTLSGNVTWAIAGADDPTSKASYPRHREPTRTLFKLGEEGSHYQMSVPSGGMGIRFNDLSEADRKLLVAIKTGLNRTKRTVRMWLDGISDTVITQGIPTDNGVELEAEIPFLKIGSSVNFSLGDERACSQGKIINVALDTSLESAVPLLHVALEMEVVREPTKRMHYQEEHVAPEKCEREHGLYGIAARNSIYEKMSPITTFRPCVTRAVKPTWNRSVSHAIIALIIAVVSVWATWVAIDTDPSAVNDTKSQTKPGTDRSLRTALMSSEKTIIKSLSGKPSTIWAEASQSAERRASANNPIAFKYDKPQISVDKDRSSVLIPLTGSDKGIREYQLSTPGIAVNLPHAQTLIPFKNYGIHRGLIKRVWVRPFDSGVQVRVITAWKKMRHHIRFSPDGLKVVLMP